MNTCSVQKVITSIIFHFKIQGMHQYWKINFTKIVLRTVIKIPFIIFISYHSREAYYIQSR